MCERLSPLDHWFGTAGEGSGATCHEPLFLSACNAAAAAAVEEAAAAVAAAGAAALATAWRLPLFPQRRLKQQERTGRAINFANLFLHADNDVVADFVAALTTACRIRCCYFSPTQNLPFCL
mmetsp:Transcript_43669/g.86625  ORF Transcript_43669/g.86625 Transcript_43669/m.86625 type:complete len:122 (+) Transcript_43669:1327-1692(+)